MGQLMSKSEDNLKKVSLTDFHIISICKKDLSGMSEEIEVEMERKFQYQRNKSKRNIISIKLKLILNIRSEKKTINKAVSIETLTDFILIDDFLDHEVEIDKNIRDLMLAQSNTLTTDKINSILSHTEIKKGLVPFHLV